MDTNPNIKELIKKDLKGFQIIEMTEVYRVDVDGRKVVSVGFFKDPDIAAAFVGIQDDTNWIKTEKALVLTDGTVGYVISEKDPVKLFDDVEEALDIRNKAIANLNPAVRKLLGYG